MGSVAVNYAVVTDTYHLAYQPADDFPGMQPEGDFSDGVLVPEGMWTAFVSPYAVSAYGGIGIVLQLQSGELLDFLAHQSPPADTEQVRFVPFPGRQITLRVEQWETGILTYSWSEDMMEWTEVESFSPSSPVTEVGVVLRYDSPSIQTGGSAGEARLLEGIWQNVAEEVWLGEADPEPELRAAAVAAVTSTSEPYVHTIVGAQFGDLEFDIGKSVRWVTWFVDNVFVLDVNLGTQRYWVVNWAETFPDARHSVTGINYFVLPKEFRAEQWKQYKLAFGEPADDDWILWIDGHEGLNVDNRSLPDDYDFAPFKSFLWREIQRAQDAGEKFAVLPYYVFLRSDDIVNVTYETVAMDPDGLVDPVLQAISTPYYQQHQGLKRLWQASELKKPDFDWAQLDAPTAPSAAAKTAVVSYGYAHWNLQDIEPPATVVPELTEANDDGWRMRKLLSRVRPIPGLPLSDTWIPPEDDPAGLPGPWAPADANNPDPIVNSGPYLDSSIGYASIPDPGPLPDEVTFVWKARSDLPLTGVDKHIASQDGLPTAGEKRAWNVYRPAFGFDHWFWLQSPDSSGWGSDLVQHLVAQLPATGEDEYLAMTVAQAPVLTTRLYRSVGGVWTPVAPATTGGAIAMTDSPSPVRIGRGMDGNGGWDGRIYWVELRTGLDPAAGTVLWRFDAADPTGWTLTDEDAIVANTEDTMEQPVTPDPSLLGLVTPLYDNAFRINMRDGVWYESGLSGNIPLKWDDARQIWTTDYDPNEWSDHGVKSYDPTAVP